MLGDAEAVVDGRVAAGRVQPGRGAHVGGRHAGDRLDGLRAVLGAGDELRPLVEVLAALVDEVLVDQALGDHHVGHGVDDRDVGARRQLAGGTAASMCGERTRSMRRGSTTISLAPSRSRRFIREANTGCPSVGLAPITMITSASATDLKSWVPADVAEGLLEPVAGRGVADPRAGVDVVVAERRAHHLLDDVDLFVGAAGGGDAADRADAVLGLDLAHATGDEPIASSHSTSRHVVGDVSRGPSA